MSGHIRSANQSVLPRGKRFDNKKDYETSNLGPGLYRPSSPQWIKANKNFNLLRSRTTERNTYQTNSTPSIPSHNYKYGYKNDQEGKPVSIGNKNLLPESEIRGPGYYHSKDDLLKKNRTTVIGYDKDTSKRQAIKSKEDVVGPGTYEVIKEPDFPLYKKLGSPPFASKTKRNETVPPRLRQISKLRALQQKPSKKM